VVKNIPSFFVRTKNEAKKSPLNSCVFPRAFTKAGAESKHSAYIPSFAYALGAAITGDLPAQCRIPLWLEGWLRSRRGVKYFCAAITGGGYCVTNIVVILSKVAGS
jgi:hypothetical protein